MKIISKILSISGILVVVVGFLFKILHWPFGTLLLITGLLLYFVSFVLSFFKQDDDNKSNPDILDDI